MNPLQNFSDAPLVTVQIAMHDGDVRYAHRCLSSVEAQGLPPGQLQVVIAYDGDPSPESDQILEVACKDRSFPIDLLNSTPKTGYYTVPRNRALARCWGFYIAHLDADNEWMPGHLSGLLTAIRIPDPNNGWPHFVYSRRQYVCDEDDPRTAPLEGKCSHNRVVGSSPLVPWTQENIGRLSTAKGNFIDTGDFLIGRGALYELAERTGCVWDSDLRRYGDWDLVRRLAEKGFRGHAVDQVTSRYHWTGGNLQLTRTVSEINFIPGDIYEKLRDQGLIRDTGAD